MQTGFGRKLANRLSGKLDFYKGWLANPKGVGAIAPSSPAVAKKMADVVRPDNQKMVMELGPGTGVFTEAILARGVPSANLIAIEYNESFLPGLRRRFPDVTFIHGDAFDIARIVAEHSREHSGGQPVEKFDAIISGLPLLNFSLDQRFQFVETMLDQLEPGRPLVQFSYGLGPPVPDHSRQFVVERLATVLGNLPPARIWSYRRAQSQDTKSNS